MEEIVPLLVPLLWANTTVDPPVVSKFPFESFVVKVKVTVLPAVTVELETVMSD